MSEDGERAAKESPIVNACLNTIFCRTVGTPSSWLLYLFLCLFYPRCFRGSEPERGYSIKIINVFELDKANGFINNIKQ
jgi:hypothetical protein